jgi:hypothetical protein
MNIDLFSIAWQCGTASFFLGLAELLGMQLFVRLVYMVGIKAYSRSSDLQRPSVKHVTEGIFKMDEGKFKFISSDECLFTSKVHFFEFRYRTPFPFKGRVVWTANGAEICGRLPIGTTLFFFFWLVCWSTGFSFHSKDIIFVIGGWLFAGLLVVASIPT